MKKIYLPELRRSNKTRNSAVPKYCKTFLYMEHPRGPSWGTQGVGGLKICSSSSAWSTLGGLFYKLFWLDDFYCGRKWQLHPTGTGSWGKISKCHISVMRQNKSKFFCACMLTLYIVTINPGLVQLGPLIREKFSILGPTLTNFPARLSAN